MTLILTRRDIRGLMAREDWIEAVERGFLASASGLGESPPPMHLEAVAGAFHAKGALLRGERPYAALKLNGNFPGNPETRNLPTIQGAVLLCDGADGRMLAILDSAEVTVRRTAAATALAARFLARPDSCSLLVCGCGEQGQAQLEAIRDVLPIRIGLVWDRDREKAESMAGRNRGVEAVADFTEAALASDVIVTCTSSTEAFLDERHVAPGTFIAAVGADSPTKSEITPGLMARATVIADVLDQCAEMGDLRQAIAAGTMTKADVHAELADLVIGRRPGRTKDGEIMLFDSTGTALQDVASAVTIYERALSRGGSASIDLAA